MIIKTLLASQLLLNPLHTPVYGYVYKYNRPTKSVCFIGTIAMPTPSHLKRYGILVDARKKRYR